MRWKQIIREWIEIDPIEAGLSYTMSMCRYQREGKTEEQFRQWCTDRIQAVWAEIKPRIRGDDTIKIWRAITLPSGESPNPNRHPGLCWTWDEDAIHPAHGHMRDHIWVYEAEADISQIDWSVTLAQNSTPGYEAEKEIRLKDYGRIDVLDVRDTGEVK